MGKGKLTVDAGPDDSTPLLWPLITIDFEASSLLRGSFPIEVGVCRWRSANDAIEGWSTLIKPVPGWNDNGSWSPTSEEVHRIPRAALDRGVAPAGAITILNAIVGDHHAFCDGGPFDAYWLTTLARAAGVVPSFKLADFDTLTGRLDQRGYMRMVRFLDRAPPRHRAGDDAERLMKALARAWGLTTGPREPSWTARADGKWLGRYKHSKTEINAMITRACKVTTGTRGE